MPALGPNEALIGVPGSRARLDTPALLIDRDALLRNIGAMAAHAKGAGVALRPHAKTHKSLRIAALQVAEGALGICCATIGEAEIMIAGGIPGVHITSPQVTPPKIARLIALNAAPHRGLSVVVDHPENVAALDDAARAAGRPLEVLVDNGAGQGRTGVAGEAELVALVHAVRAAAGLAFRGIQSYSGNLQHIATRAERRARAREQAERLGHMLRRLRGDGIAVPIVTGAGTGTYDLDPEARIFTELQVGSYVFMDVDYQRALADGRNAPPFETSLFVATAVVSVNAVGYVTTDAGLKCFATDGPAPEVARGAPPESRYAFFGDEHGKLILPPSAPRPPLGTLIECVTPHCDPTVNLHDFYHLVQGDTLVDIWPVDARGKR
ncbi:MAG TPA: DSD1 family PLP-dependent enzyme [Stellaceae bacterium]|nr:DSD1 family PLP-dependent enzyme [Stellaceae bacterium]